MYLHPDVNSPFAGGCATLLLRAQIGRWTS